MEKKTSNKSKNEIIEVIIETKKKKYPLVFKKGEDLLILLDKFLKKNKINKKEVIRIKPKRSFKKSFVSEQIVLTISKAFSLFKKFE